MVGNKVYLLWGLGGVGEEDRDNHLTFSSMGNALGGHEILGRTGTEVANCVSLKKPDR